MRCLITALCAALLAAACTPAQAPPLVVTTPTAEPLLTTLQQAGGSSREWVNPATLSFPQPAIDAPLREGQHVARRTAGMDYWVYVPPGYAQAEQPWPVILFLHGSGGHEGGNPHNALTWGLPVVVLERDLPAVIVTPHYPAGTLWEEHITAVEAVLDDALAETHTDPNRVAITGVSAGGFAAWAQVIHSPQRYAALLSVSGSGYRTVQGVPAPLGEFCKVTEVPTRAIHGLADTLAEPRIIRAFVERVERCPDPGSVELIMWEGEGHLSTAARAYNDDQILGWLLDTIR